MTAAMTKVKIAAARARTVAMAAANAMVMEVVMVAVMGMATATRMAALREIALAMQLRCCNNGGKGDCGSMAARATITTS